MKTTKIDGQTYLLVPIADENEVKSNSHEKCVKGWYELEVLRGGVKISEDSLFFQIDDDFANGYNKNTFASLRFAESAVAFAQLSYVYDDWKRKSFLDWEADWKDANQKKYIPTHDDEGTTAMCSGVLRGHFPFPSLELCEAFIDCPEIAGLLRTFYMIEE